MSLRRRDFLKGAVAAGAGLVLGNAPAAHARAAPRSAAPTLRDGQAPDVVVVGAGAFGAWTALHLQRMGARVTLLDRRGPANSRATSGGETRGVRTSYGDRPHGLQWARWAEESIRRWQAWDEEHAHELLAPLYYTTGDVILRPEMEPFLERTRENWDAMGRPYEVLTPEEVRYRWPVMQTPEMTVALFEPDAGVVRARRAIESVAHVFRREGGTLALGRFAEAVGSGGRVEAIRLTDGSRVSAGSFVFALGPWFPKTFPELMGRRMRIRTLGHVYYLAPPEGDRRFEHPHLPSYNVPGVTGWAALPNDHRGFRIRTGSHRGEDPDTSVRWIDAEYHERPREVLRTYFPAMAEQPINETRACHYCGTVTDNFIIDRHWDWDNAWLAGGGNAEAFKQGPVIGEFVAGRVLGHVPDDDELAVSFRLSEEEYEEDEGGA